MSVGITHVLTVLSIMQYTLKIGDQNDTVMQYLLCQHKEQKNQEMIWLLEEMEQRNQEPCDLTQEGVLLSGLAALVVLGLCQNAACVLWALLAAQAEKL